MRSMPIRIGVAARSGAIRPTGNIEVGMAGVDTGVQNRDPGVDPRIVAVDLRHAILVGIDSVHAGRQHLGLGIDRQVRRDRPDPRIARQTLNLSRREIGREAANGPAVDLARWCRDATLTDNPARIHLILEEDDHWPRQTFLDRHRPLRRPRHRPCRTTRQHECQPDDEREHPRSPRGRAFARHPSRDLHYVHAKSPPTMATGSIQPRTPLPARCPGG